LRRTEDATAKALLAFYIKVGLIPVDAFSTAQVCGLTGASPGYVNFICRLNDEQRKALAAGTVKITDLQLEKCTAKGKGERLLSKFDAAQLAYEGKKTQADEKK
jgi:hypothetical protein